jgi:hypothetical protein
VHSLQADDRARKPLEIEVMAMRYPPKEKVDIIIYLFIQEALLPFLYPICRGTTIHHEFQIPSIRYILEFERALNI